MNKFIYFVTIIPENTKIKERIPWDYEFVLGTKYFPKEKRRNNSLCKIFDSLPFNGVCC